MNCPICNKIYSPATALVKRGYGKYCSSKCYGVTMIGIKQSPEITKKRMDGFRKAERTEQWRRNISESKQGNRSHFWKGGVTETNRIIRGSFSYGIWRRGVLKRDNHTCVICGSKEKIQADHIKPFSDYPELRFDIDNGRAICEPCHKKTESYGNHYWRAKKAKEGGYIK